MFYVRECHYVPQFYTLRMADAHQEQWSRPRESNPRPFLYEFSDLLSTIDPPRSLSFNPLMGRVLFVHLLEPKLTYIARQTPLFSKIPLMLCVEFFSLFNLELLNFKQKIRGYLNKAIGWRSHLSPENRSN